MSAIDDVLVLNPADTVRLLINRELEVELTLANAYGLMLFATGIGWSKTGLTRFSTKLEKPITFDSSNDSWPAQTTSSLYVSGNAVENVEGHDAPYEDLWFTTGPHADQTIQVQRLDILRALNKYFVARYGSKLQLKDNYLVDIAALQKTDRVVESGAPGVWLSIGDYVNFRVDSDAGKTQMVDVELFLGNQNIPRPSHVDKIGFVLDTYIGSMNEKPRRAAIEFHLNPKTNSDKEA